MTDLELRRLLTHYAQGIAAEGKSPTTVKGYREIIGRFFRYLETEGLPDVLTSLNLGTARDYILYQLNRGLSPFTAQDDARALKAFASWLHREDYTTDNLLSRLKIPKAPFKIIEILTPEEIDRLIKIKDPLTEYGCRDIAILLTFLDSGLRDSELCDLDLADTHIEEGYLKVMGKGAKERLVPIGNRTQQALWRYVIHFRPKPATGKDHLFLTAEGYPIHSNTISQLFRRWRKKADIPRLHAHLCRHTFATNFLVNNCGDVFRLQQILGHTSLEMVRRYVHLASGQSMLRNRPSSPLDSLDLASLRGRRIDHLLENKKRHAKKRSSQKYGRR
jgi:site-specific recombinase XerD